MVPPRRALPAMVGLMVIKLIGMLMLGLTSKKPQAIRMSNRCLSPIDSADPIYSEMGFEFPCPPLSGALPVGISHGDGYDTQMENKLMRDYQVWQRGDETVTFKVDNYGAGYCVDIDGEKSIKDAVKLKLDTSEEVSTEWAINPNVANETYRVLTVRALPTATTVDMVDLVCDALMQLQFAKI